MALPWAASSHSPSPLWSERPKRLVVVFQHALTIFPPAGFLVEERQEGNGQAFLRRWPRTPHPAPDGGFSSPRLRLVAVLVETEKRVGDP